MIANPGSPSDEIPPASNGLFVAFDTKRLFGGLATC